MIKKNKTHTKHDSGSPEILMNTTLMEYPNSDSVYKARSTVMVTITDHRQGVSSKGDQMS